MQQGQLTTEQIWVVGTITFSAKRSTHAVGHAVDAVGVDAKRSTQCTQQMWVLGTVTFSAKR